MGYNRLCYGVSLFYPLMTKLIIYPIYSNRKNVPSHFSRVLFFLPAASKSHNSPLIPSRISRSILIKEVIIMGATTAVIPRTNNMLKMLDPIEFPIARSTLPFLAAVMPVTTSGREVPIAIIVAEIMY